MGQFVAIHPECQFDPVTESVVREEIAQILDHQSFRQSERCSKLLRYLVEISLVPDAVPLKERAIGHEVFGRPISYDTYSDPVVRNAASEIRKRLRQYQYELLSLIKYAWNYRTAAIFFTLNLLNPRPRIPRLWNYTSLCRIRSAR